MRLFVYGVGGHGAFPMQMEDFPTFTAAVPQKLLRGDGGAPAAAWMIAEIVMRSGETLPSPRAGNQFRAGQ